MILFVQKTCRSITYGGGGEEGGMLKRLGELAELAANPPPRDWSGEPAKFWQLCDVITLQGHVVTWRCSFKSTDCNDFRKSQFATHKAFCKRVYLRMVPRNIISKIRPKVRLPFLGRGRGGS